MFIYNHLQTLVVKRFIGNCCVIVRHFFVSSDWDGIMERDSHQGEAQGVKICDPTSESNPPGKLFNCSLQLF